jgi:hypothetical protein
LKDSNIIILLIIVSIFTTVIYTPSAIAQNQSKNLSAKPTTNNTVATLTDTPQTLIIKQTTIPINQTTVTVSETTKPNQSSHLEPLSNQTSISQGDNLSNFKNKTVIQPIGPATTTVVNQTTTPFNQSTLQMGNTTE